MITLTRLDKKQLRVNPDLIKTVEAIPDTIVMLTTGERFYVRESVEEVVARFVGYQHTIRQQRAQGILVPMPAGAPSPEAEPAPVATDVQQGVY
ncbi:MAG: flagellar FlbD family protein [Verrucomicrobia bacterium]|nr:flagellar FlbD family protein [Verrucomicrobiota bacterium]